MKRTSRLYLFGAIFIGLGIYYAAQRDYLELCLYALAGLSFIVTALTLDPKSEAFRKPLVILSWVLIAATGILFLYMLQFKYL